MRFLGSRRKWAGRDEVLLPRIIRLARCASALLICFGMTVNGCGSLWLAVAALKHLCTDVPSVQAPSAQRPARGKPRPPARVGAASLREERRSGSEKGTQQGEGAQQAWRGAGHGLSKCGRCTAMPADQNADNGCVGFRGLLIKLGGTL